MDYFSASNLHKLDQLLRILIFLRIILLHPIEELAITTSYLYYGSDTFLYLLGNWLLTPAKIHLLAYTHKSQLEFLRVFLLTRNINILSPTGFENITLYVPELRMINR